MNASLGHSIEKIGNCLGSLRTTPTESPKVELKIKYDKNTWIQNPPAPLWGHQAVEGRSLCSYVLGLESKVLKSKVYKAV